MNLRIGQENGAWTPISVFNGNKKRGQCEFSILNDGQPFLLDKEKTFSASELLEIKRHLSSRLDVN